MKLPTTIYLKLVVKKQMTGVELLLLHSNAWNYSTVYKQIIYSKQNY